MQEVGTFMSSGKLNFPWSPGSKLRCLSINLSSSSLLRVSAPWVMGHGSPKRANILNSNLNKLETQKGELEVKTEEGARAGCHTSVNFHKASAPSHWTCVVKIASQIEPGLDQWSHYLNNLVNIKGDVRLQEWSPEIISNFRESEWLSHHYLDK